MGLCAVNKQMGSIGENNEILDFEFVDHEHLSGKTQILRDDLK